MNDNQDNKANQEKAFHKALKSYGYIFPETEKELRAFEASIYKMEFDIPDKFNNPLKILNEGRIEKVNEFHSFYDEQVEENLAQAAREGSNIPDEVWKQMDNDRKKAEEANDDKNTD